MRRAPCERCQQCALYFHFNGEHDCQALRKFEPSNVECRFFQTPEQLYEGRKAGYERLKEKGRDDLIQLYGVTPPVKYGNEMLDWAGGIFG